MTDNDRYTKMLAFAGEKSILQPLNTINSPQHLHSAFERIQNWTEKNNMVFNREKFEMLNIGEKARAFHFVPHHGKQIEAKDNIKNLLFEIGNSLKKLEFH